MLSTIGFASVGEAMEPLASGEDVEAKGDDPCSKKT